MQAGSGQEHRVLVIDDESIVCKTLKRALGRPSFTVEVFEDPVLALKRLEQQRFDIVVTDVVMGDVDGIRILGAALGKDPQTKVIIMTAFACMDLAREAMAKGAFDFIAKPFTAEAIRAIVDKAAEALRGDPNGENQTP
ncbi:MAG: response regulator [Planctomycetota bacterium]